MAANATAEQLGLDIAGLEQLLEAEVQARGSSRPAPLTQPTMPCSAMTSAAGWPGPGRGGPQAVRPEAGLRMAAQAKLDG